MILALAVKSDPQEFDCRTCRDKAGKGCEVDSPIPDKWVIGGVKSQRCPVKLFDSTEIVWINLHALWRAKMFYLSGGLADQPAVYADAMMFLDLYSPSPSGRGQG